MVSKKSRISQKYQIENSQGISSDQFVQLVLEQRFGNDFRKVVGRHRYMFESNSQLIYFQNYNKESDGLWYRIKGKVLQFLLSSQKQSWLCLTYPPGNIAYIFPVKVIEEQIKLSGWNRDELEINIIHSRSQWHPFNWDIKEYCFELKKS